MITESLRRSTKQALKSLRSINLNENAPDVEGIIQTLPFYHLVPKEPLLNLKWREELFELCEQDPELCEQLKVACARDKLFFINTFLWVFEPRKAVDYPFVTWQFQDRLFMHMHETIGNQDLGVEKSRDMGMTWMAITEFFCLWMFRPKTTLGLVATDLDAVDKTDDPDTLMWKLDYHYDNLPSWMKPPRNRIKNSMRNSRNRAVITGYAATSDVGRGGRKYCFFFDEAAFWSANDGYGAWAAAQYVSDSRLMVSTPCGMAGIFPDQMKRKDADMRKVSIHWTEHPDKVRGLYYGVDGKLTILDEEYAFPEDYPFILDGKLRSPYYDSECRRHPIPALIAQELDIDYGGSGFPFFKPQEIEDHMLTYGIDSQMEGEVLYDNNTPEVEPAWTNQPGGHTRLWIPLTAEDEPPHTYNYVVACDISAGTAGDMSTNSVAVVYNQLTGEKVAECAVNFLSPERFADYVDGLSRWFWGPDGVAYVIWETNGPGEQFTKRFVEIHPERIYYRENLKTKDGKPTQNPGWRSSRETKRMVLGHYGMCLAKGMVINHSEQALEEMYHYIHLPTGAIEHDRSQVALDPSAAGENHGDRVIADALANWVLNKTGTLERSQDSRQTTNRSGEPPYGTAAHRAWLAEQDRQKELQGSWM